MRFHDSYKYHRERLGLSDAVARGAASHQGVLKLASLAEVSPGAFFRRRWKRSLAVSWRAPKPFDVAGTWRLLKRGGFRTEQAFMKSSGAIIDAITWVIASHVNAGSVCSIAHIVAYANRHLPPDMQVEHRDGVVRRRPRQVQCIGGEMLPENQVVASALFPGGWVERQLQRIRVVVPFRGKLKLTPWPALTPAEATLAGCVPLRDVLTGVMGMPASRLARYRYLRVSSTRVPLEDLYVPPTALELEQVEKFSDGRLALVRDVRRLAYHSSAEGKMSPPEGEATTYGFEWELVGARGAARVISAVESGAEAAKLEVGYEADSSLGPSGVEVVSAPDTLPALLSKLDILNAVAGGKIRTAVAELQTQYSGGIHIHISDTAFASTAARCFFQLIFNAPENDVFVARVARRAANRYASPLRLPGGWASRLEEPCYERYKNANQRARTTEVRIFRSAPNASLVAQALRFVASVKDYANYRFPASISLPLGFRVNAEDCSAARFVTWALAKVRSGDLYSSEFVTEEELLTWAGETLRDPNATDNEQWRSIIDAPRTAPLTDVGEAESASEAARQHVVCEFPAIIFTDLPLPDVIASDLDLSAMLEEALAEYRS